MIQFFRLDKDQGFEDRSVSSREPSHLINEMTMYRSFDSLGTDQDCSSPERARKAPKQPAANAPKS
jgi:hypothetical protein